MSLTLNVNNITAVAGRVRVVLWGGAVYSFSPVEARVVAAALVAAADEADRTCEAGP